MLLFRLTLKINGVSKIQLQDGIGGSIKNNIDAKGSSILLFYQFNRLRRK